LVTAHSLIPSRLSSRRSTKQMQSAEKMAMSGYLAKE
jgi:hypothetical protein